MLGCAALVAALATAEPGAVLTLAPGSNCPRIEILQRTWDKPITVVATGATINSLHILRSRGIRWQGGTITRPDGFRARGAASEAITISYSQNLELRDIAVTRAGRGLVLARSSGARIEGLTITDVRSDCMMIGASRDVVIRNNICAGFDPIPTRCTIKPAEPAQPAEPADAAVAKAPPAAPVEPRLVEGLSRRACVAEGGTWRDGDHPDAIQIFGSPEGFPLDNILVENNRSVGRAQCFGMFMAPGDKGSRVVMRNNYCETSARHAILISYCTDCEATGNVARRYGNSSNRTLMRAVTSTGKFCSNDNPHAPRNSQLTQRCPS